MGQVRNQRIFAIFIGFIMLSSVAGFAHYGIFASGGNTQTQTQEPQGYTIPTVVERQLGSQEISSVLQQGGVIIQSMYHEDCGSCRIQDQTARLFAQQYSNFIIMESLEVTTGEGFQRFHMIGGTGEVLELGEEVTQESLLDAFCSVTLLQPRECLFRTIGQDNAPPTPPAGDSMTDHGG